MKDEQRSNGLLQPMLSDQQRLLGSSEGDINQNMNLSSTSSPNLLGVDGNNNSNSNDDLEASGEGRDGDSDRVNLPIDRRKSTVEPLQRTRQEADEDQVLEKAKRRSVTSLLINGQAVQNGGGVDAQEDVEDIDGSSTELDFIPGAGSEVDLILRPPSTPASICSGNC